MDDHRNTTSAPRQPLPRLDELTDVLVSARPGTGALVGLLDAPGGDGPELLLQPTGSDGPFAQLVGWHAPPHWRALGVLGPATVRSRGLTHDGTVALMVHRSGASSFSLAVDGTREPLELTRGTGRMFDGCRRALRLPTPPLRSRPAAWFAQRWLDLLLAGLAAGEVYDWEAAARLHPLAVLADDPTDLVALARHPAARACWDDLRLTVAAGHGDTSLPEARLAAWMDAPMFGRWMLDARPPLDELAAAVADLAPPPVAERVAAVLRVWR